MRFPFAPVDGHALPPYLFSFLAGVGGGASLPSGTTENRAMTRSFYNGLICSC